MTRYLPNTPIEWIGCIGMCIAAPLACYVLCVTAGGFQS